MRSTLIACLATLAVAAGIVVGVQARTPSDGCGAAADVIAPATYHADSGVTFQVIRHRKKG